VAAVAKTKLNRRESFMVGPSKKCRLSDKGSSKNSTMIETKQIRLAVAACGQPVKKWLQARIDSRQT
jgi:hypothetical protein